MEEADDINNQLIDRIINTALRGSTFKPPLILYKYLSDERVEDVLGNGSVRFTPLSNTNDSFEVRTTFETFAGPKLIKMYKDAMQNVLRDSNFDAILKSSFDSVNEKHGIVLNDSDQAFEYFKKTKGKEIKKYAKNIVIKHRKTKLFPSLNSEEQTNKFLEAMGKKLCFSLSEQADIPPMWAHYANHHKGFVIAFDTTHIWFKEWNNGESKHLIKVPYFDDKMKEPFDDPYKAIVSKGTCWDYEHEWRTHANETQADTIEKTPEELIHLINFPPEAVQRIILGEKIKPEVESKIKEIVGAKYPHAEIYRMRSNPVENCMEEVKV